VVLLRNETSGEQPARFQIFVGHFLRHEFVVDHLRFVAGIDNVCVDATTALVELAKNIFALSRPAACSGV